MRVLLDTCAVSELKRPRPNPGVLAAIGELPSENLLVSVLTVGELASGVARLEDGQRKNELAAWLRALERDYAERLLPVDLEIAQIWGELSARAKPNGKNIPAVDGLIAATAIRHGLHLMTRNDADFRETGALIINPWTG